MADRMGASARNEYLSDYASGLYDKTLTKEAANFVAPVVPVGGSIVQYTAHDSENAFRQYDTNRSLGGKRRRIEHLGELKTLTLGPGGLEIALDDAEVKAKGGEAFRERLKRAKVRTLLVLTGKARLATVADAAIAAKPTAYSGVGNWTDDANDPVKELNAVIYALWQKNGLWPNRLQLDPVGWKAFIENAKVIARFSGIKSRVGLEDLKGLFLNPNLEIGLTDTAVRVANEGQASKTKKSVLGGNALVFYGEDMISEEDPSFMKTFVSEEVPEGVNEYRDETCASDVMFLDWYIKPEVTSTDLAERIAIT